jgi:hypothetical protein
MVLGISELEGRFAPVLAFEPKTARIAFTEVVEPLVKKFFASRGVTRFAHLPEVSPLHEEDFIASSGTPIGRLYELLFDDLSRDSSGMLVHTVKWSLTLDEDICPEVCQITDLKFGRVTLAGRDVAFVIVAPVTAIMRYLRGIGRPRLVQTGELVL